MAYVGSNFKCHTSAYAKPINPTIIELDKLGLIRSNKITFIVLIINKHAIYKQKITLPQQMEYRGSFILKLHVEVSSTGLH